MSVHITSCALCGDTKLTWYLKNSSFSDVPFATLPSVTGRCATKMSAYYCPYFLEVSLVDLKQICKTYSSSRKVVLAESPSPPKNGNTAFYPRNLSAWRRLNCQPDAHTNTTNWRNLLQQQLQNHARLLLGHIFLESRKCACSCAGMASCGQMFWPPCPKCSES